jgi:hypothetical protein
MIDEIYILAVERDTYEPDETSRSIVFEQNIDNGAGTLEAVKAHQQRLGGRYGKTRIAKLDFIEDWQEIK